MTSLIRAPLARLLLALGSIAAVGALAVAQTTPVAHHASAAGRTAFVVGEELTYKASFSKLPVGTARMRVAGVDTVRGRLAYHLVFTLDGGIPGFRVHDRYDSWVDVETHASLRYAQSIHEGGYKRARSYEIYPERGLYQEERDTAASPSVREPLDDGSFIYAVRHAGVRVGETQRFDRYFKPDRNPVVLSGLTRDTITVGAGTFATVVVRPTIRTKGLFAEDGDAKVWLTDDDARYPVKIATKFSKFSLTLTLASVNPGLPDGGRSLIASLRD